MGSPISFQPAQSLLGADHERTCMSEIKEGEPVAKARDTETRSKAKSVSAQVCLGAPAATEPGKRLLAVEFCAGSGGLSAAILDAGLSAVGIDWQCNSHRARAPIMEINLCSESGQSLAWRLFETHRVVYVHCAPPTETMKRTGERRRSHRQMRSANHPCGLPTLKGAELMMVRDANTLAAFIASVCSFAHSQGIGWSIEGPRDSYLWMLKEYVELQVLEGVRDRHYHTCMFGSQRRTQQRWRSNVDELHVLDRHCNHTHTHPPWVMDPTSQDYEYTQSLCKEAAAAVIGFVSRSFGEDCRPRMKTRVILRTIPQEKRERARARAAGGAQARGARYGQLINEYKETVLVDTRFPLPLRVGDQLKVVTRFGDKLVPKGARLLEVQHLDEQGVVSEIADTDEVTGVRVKFGIFHSPLEFFEKAKLLHHPYDVEDETPDAVRRAIFRSLTIGVVGVEEHRRAMFEKWERRAEELQQKEDELHQTMDEVTARVYRKKRLLLLQEMLASIGHLDRELVRELAVGMPLIGEMTQSLIFPPKRVEPLHGPEWLHRSALLCRRNLLSSMKPSRDAEFDKELHRITVDERDDPSKAWVTGPYTEEQLDQLLGPGWVLAKRFGIRQGAKCRPIDDLSANFVNSCVGTCEKILCGGVDELVSITRSWAEAFFVGQDGEFTVTLSCGQVLKGTLHADFRGWERTRLVGKCADLEAAYRQIAVQRSQLCYAPFAVWSPASGKPEIYINHALPFGATAAVYSSNRAFRALSTLLATTFLVPCTNYYDDFPIVVPAQLAPSTEATLTRFESLLGWTFKGGEKALPFAEEFAVLGVRLDLAGAAEAGEVKVGNKKERVEKIVAEIEEILASGCIHSAQAASLRGKLMYAVGQTFGKCGGAAAKVLSHRASASGGSSGLNEQLRWALTWWKLYLSSAPERKVSLRRDQRPVLIFTDGACEGVGSDLESSHGGFMYDPADGCMEAFGGVFPPRVMAFWTRGGGKRQVIAQAEVAPAVTSRQLWHHRLAGRRVLHFVDNEGAREGLIKGSSMSRESLLLLSTFWDLESLCGTYCWFERVPSFSNVSDGPSRGVFEEVLALGAVVRSVPELPESVYGQR